MTVLTVMPVLAVSSTGTGRTWRRRRWPGRTRGQADHRGDIDDPRVAAVEHVLQDRPVSYHLGCGCLRRVVLRLRLDLLERFPQKGASGLAAVEQPVRPAHCLPFAGLLPLPLPAACVETCNSSAVFSIGVEPVVT